MSDKKKSSSKSALARREPSADLRSRWPWSRGVGLRSDRLIDRFFDEMSEELPSFSNLLAPAIDLDENDTHYTVTTEIPGVDKDDVTIELTERTLTIRGEKKSESEEKSDRRRYSERTYGSFRRSISLPQDADEDPARVEASFKNGVLTVTVPRSEEAKPSVIAIR